MTERQTLAAKAGRKSSTAAPPAGATAAAAAAATVEDENAATSPADDTPLITPAVVVVEEPPQKQQQQQQQQQQRKLKFRNYTPNNPALDDDNNNKEIGRSDASSAPGSQKRRRTGNAANNTAVPGVNTISSRASTRGVHPDAVKVKSVLEEALEKARLDVLLHQSAGRGSKDANVNTKNSSLSTTTAAAANHQHHTQPHKINADLKRHIQPSLDKLAKRTQKAIVSLLQERLAQEAVAAAANNTDNTVGAEEKTDDLD